MTDTDHTAYADWAADLRRLARQLDDLRPDLPQPAYPEQHLRILLGLPERCDIEHVAAVLGVNVDVRGLETGQTTATLGVGSVDLDFYHIDDAAALAYVQGLEATS